MNSPQRTTGRAFWQTRGFLLGAPLLLLGIAFAWRQLSPSTFAAWFLSGAQPVAADAPVYLKIHGRVVDASGAPAPGAKVRGSWRSLDAKGGEYQGYFVAIAYDDGTYRHEQAFDTDTLRRTDRPQVELVVRAEGRFGECRSSGPQTLTVEGRSETALDLMLGAPLPTVPVRVVDRDGQPLTEFWVQALPAGEESMGPDIAWPQRYKDFPDGVAELGVPERPFRVEVHLQGGKRSRTVGPFDPGQLPTRIDVVLPDE